MLRDETVRELKPIGSRLIVVTDGCRDDMHEPDEQGLLGRVIGCKLDNAVGERVTEAAMLGGYQELVIALDRLSSNGTVHKVEHFNLADILALARIGARYLFREWRDL